MPISGLLLTLKPVASLQAETIAALRARPEIEVGQAVQSWLPIAIDVTDDAASRELHDWISALPAVEFVDVVSVHFEQPDSPAPAHAEDESFCEVQLCQ